MAKFYGIGVGPGDEKLLTLKAVEVLNMLDVLLIPETQKGKDGVAKKIANKYLREDLVVKYIDFPMVVDEDVFIKAGQKAGSIIEECVKENKNVGFITLGDPSVYSTYGYIVKAVIEKVEVETVPGIPCFCLAAAMANKPLVEKDEILSIIPMNANDERVKSAMEASDATVFMKVYNREDRLIELLESREDLNESYLAIKCGFEDAKIKENTLDALRENKDYLSIVHTRK